METTKNNPTQSAISTRQHITVKKRYTIVNEIRTQKLRVRISFSNASLMFEAFFNFDKKKDTLP